MDLTVIDQAGTRTEHVSVPDSVAAGRIATRLVQAMGLPQAGAAGRPIAYGFRHEASGRQIGDEETLAQAQVSENDVLRLIALSSAPGYTTAQTPIETQARSPAPPAPRVPAGAQAAETAVLSPAPPPPSLQAAPPTRSWQPFIAIAAAALAIALIGVAVAVIVSQDGGHETRLVAHAAVTEATVPTDTATATESETPESASGETGETTTPTSTGEGVLPSVSTQQMATEIQGTLRDWHDDVVQGDYHAAWELLSARKQAQAEGEGGYAAWAKNQATLRPYLNPAGLTVSVEDTEAETGVAQVDVTGMTWDKPGAHCSEWSGITWVKYENGEWRYDPGYSTTQQREQEWKSRYTKLLGGSC